MQQPPIFLISSGRCGSTFFSDSIHSHPEMLSVSELIEPVMPVPFLENQNKISGADFFTLLAAPTMAERIDIWQSGITRECLFMPQEREQVSLLLCYALPLISDQPEKYLNHIKQIVSDFPEASAAEHFIRFCEYLKSAHGKKIWIERSGGSLAHCESILRCWPNAKIIHFYRDGRDVACSMRAHPIFRMFVMKRLGLDWKDNETPDISEFGKLWSEWVCNAIPALTKPDIRVLNLSYEEMMSSPDSALGSFLRFVFDKETLHEQDLQWINQVKQEISPSRNHVHALNEKEKERLTLACQPGLKELGYETNSAPILTNA
ncbi:sulfotransferase [Amphritea pacifica]|uniref:Sulfotransferase n=1 Tax=Amphritea pacifica TaxID=2811233 RepID=A0ABS2W5S2_9GAMM|nr:sulfotransferase [Amphritea pacifica]MBN0987062.1 sulfotransferase [Amphritea pacifica]